MTLSQLIVTFGGLAAIGWVYWYFLRAQRGPAVRAAREGALQVVAVEVKSGYSPARIEVRAGEPVRINFTRLETSSCTEEVVFPDFGIRTFLPPHQTTPVEFTAERPGTYPFSCGMGMVHGTIVATGPA